MKYSGTIFDMHVHVLDTTRTDDVLQLQRDYGYNGFNILSLEAITDGQNDMAFALSQRTGCTVFAGLNHKPAPGTSDEPAVLYAEQAREMLARGALGYKMIEGKPDVYRNLAKRFNTSPLTSNAMMDFYAELERQGAVLLLHAGDPPEFWSNAPDWAKEAGCAYDDPDFPRLETIRTEVEEIAQRFPKLNFILAHFYFIANDIKEATRLLDTYPCLVFDLCPGVEMYPHFSKNPDAWREFFMKYNNRILFGTDNCETSTPKERADKDVINRMVHQFLQSSEKFLAWDLEIQGIDLPVDVLENIYHKNFQRLTGKESE